MKKSYLLSAACIFSIFMSPSHAVTVQGTLNVTLGGVPIDKPLFPIQKFNKIDLLADISDIQKAAFAFDTGQQLIGSGELHSIADDDPWLNIRYELENLTNQQQFFSLDILLPTMDTSGPTIKDAFMNIELIDVDSNSSVFVANSTSSFTVIDDTIGSAGDSIAQSGFFQFYSGEGSHSVFDVTGSGPNSDLFTGSAGFNFMRFLTNGEISPGDKLVITAHGCYANNAADCPSRFTIPASTIPVPAAIWLFGSGLLGLVGIARRKKAA